MKILLTVWAIWATFYGLCGAGLLAHNAWWLCYRKLKAWKVIRETRLTREALEYGILRDIDILRTLGETDATVDDPRVQRVNARLHALVERYDREVRRG